MNRFKFKLTCFGVRLAMPWNQDAVGSCLCRDAHRRETLGVVLLLVFGLIGCNRGPNNSTSELDQHAAASIEPIEPDNRDTKANLVESALLSDTSNDAEVDLETELDDTLSVAAEKELVGALVGDNVGAENTTLILPFDDRPPTDSTELLWIPASDGVLIIGIRILIDGKPLEEVFESQIDTLLGLIPKSDGEVPKWDDLFDFVGEHETIFATSAEMIDGQSKTLIRQYDRNTNRRVDREELTRFLFRMSSSSKPFRLFGTDAMQWISRHASPLFESIDANDDRLIDEAELENLADRLLLDFDRNLDRCLSFEELTRTTENDADPWRNNRASRRGEVAMNLGGYSNWSDMAYTLGGFSNYRIWYSNESVEEKFDGDQDGRFTSDEAAAIEQVSPAIVVTIDIASPIPMPITVWVDPEVQGIVQVDPTFNRSVWINSHEGSVCVSLANDVTAFTPMGSFEKIAEKVLIEAQTETPDDSPKPYWTSQVRGRAANFPDQMFVFLDQNHDCLLSQRELDQASEQIRSVGMPFRADRIPESISLQLTMGDPSSDAQRFMFRRLEIEGQNNLPRWAKVADANGDGDLTELEFIGPIELFRRFDHNGDGYISITEIQSITRQYESGEPESAADEI
ncbi:EF-hand domain-containing protein [Rhodopirellula sp. MGV]|uniref:EF-hand domain-containing protein n=1 Tax=Rhodopirellula sp. MGV TaxID=2023130 RepID=UPI000B978A3D|nr:EF-hand domain-containing protein [Rhodopirellula sp. MGV]